MLFPQDPSDWLAFLVRIQWTLISSFLCSATAFVVFYLKPFPGKRSLVLVSVVAALILMIGVLRKATGREMLLTLLGSEDDHVAEHAYRKLEGQTQATWLLRRVNDKTEEANVRFYLARMLVTNPENVDKRSDVIARINPDRIAPRFFATNAFNSDAEVIQAPFTTRDVALHYAGQSKR